MDSKLSNDALMTQLQAITQDLWWISETDAPFQVLDLGPSSPDQPLINHLQLPPDVSIRTDTLDAFLKHATQTQDWHGPQEQADVQSYQTLQTTLNDNLKDLQVYLIGDIEIDVFILGRTTSNQVIGLSTKAVMT